MGNEEKVSLIEYEQDLGNARELPPEDKARFTIASCLLIGLALIVLLSGAALLFGPAERVAEAKLLFEFVKTVVPPIATLVIGFYFRNGG